MITSHDKLSCAIRELGMREAVYPKQVAAKRMSQENADRQIAVMKAIVEDYRKLAAAEPLPPPAQGTLLAD